MYGISTDHVKNDQQTNYFPFSEQLSNVSLDKAYYQELNGGYEAITFNLSRSADGMESILTSSFLKPGSGKIKTRKDGTTETQKEADERVVKSFNSKLRHIAFAAGMTEEEAANVTPGADFKSFIENFSKALNNRATKNLCYAKIVPNNKGYSTLPNFPPFMASMEAGDPGFKFNEDEKDMIKALATNTSNGDTGDTIGIEDLI